MSEWQLGFVAVYLLGRAFFYDMQIVLSGKTVQRNALLKRMLWGMLLIFFAPDLSCFLLGFLLYTLLLLADSFFKSAKPAHARWYYAGHWLLLLGTWYLILPWANARMTGAYENPLYRMPCCAVKNLKTFLLVFDGFLVTQKEGTIWIRLILQRLRAIPKQKNQKAGSPRI